MAAGESAVESSSVAEEDGVRTGKIEAFANKVGCSCPSLQSVLIFYKT